MSVDELTTLIDEQETKRPRRGLIALMTLGVLAAVVILLLISRGGDRSLAELRVRDNQVEVKAGSDFRRGVEGQELTFGNTVRTNSDGQAQVDYFDGSVTRLDSNTTFVVGELVDDPGTRRISARLEAGRVWNRVEKASASQDRVELFGASALATVRGTSYMGDCSLSRDVCYWLRYSGIINVTGQGETMVLDRKDDCVRSDSDGMRPCTNREIAALKDLSFYRESVAALELGELEALATPSPSASPTAAATTRPRSIPRVAPAGNPTTPAPATAEPRPRPRSLQHHDKEETHDDDDDPDPTREPRESPTDPPTPPTPPARATE